MNGFPVNALAVYGTDLFVSGDFTSAGGIAASKIAKWDGTSWSALGSGFGASVVAMTVPASRGPYVAGTFGVSQWKSDLVASVSSFSVTADSAGTQLAFVSRSDDKPYYMTFNGTRWNSPSQVGTDSVYGPITLATSADSTKWLIAWERAGQIEYRKYSSSAWGTVRVASTTS